MRLTAFTDYTLRVLMYLGLRGERLSTIGEIARAYGISENHLMKVVHYGARAGLLETVRGKGGGVRLGRDPAEIRIGALVRAIESDTPLVECFDPQTSSCRIAPACALQGLLVEAREAFFRVLDRYTLADLLRPRARLATLLAPPAGARRPATARRAR